MPTRHLSRFAHLSVALLASGCFAPLVPPLDFDASGTSDAMDEASSGMTSPSSSDGALDDSTGEPAACGNGLLDPGEVCDDGINDGTYGGCSEGCSAFAARCGDGVVHEDEGEACDDGDQTNGDGCNIDCVVSGTVLWSDIVDGTGSGLPDGGTAVAIGPDGMIFVAGTIDTGTETLSKVWLRSYTSDGSATWTEIRNADGDLDTADVRFLDTGELVVGAVYDEPAANRVPAIFAYTPAGTPQWDFIHTQSRNSISLAAAPGGFIALASDANQAAWLRRFEAGGIATWTETAPLMLDDGDIASFPDGGFVIAGEMGSDVWVRRFTPEGEELWTQMFDEYGDVSGIVVTASEEIVVAGYDPDYWVEGLDANGGSRWSDSRAEPDGWFYAFDVAPTPEDGVIVVGMRKQAGDSDLGRLYAARYSSMGTLMWEQALASPFLADGTARASAVAVDDAGGVVVVGAVETDHGRDIWVLKLAA